MGEDGRWGAVIFSERGAPRGLAGCSVSRGSLGRMRQPGATPRTSQCRALKAGVGRLFELLPVAFPNQGGGFLSPTISANTNLGVRPLSCFPRGRCSLGGPSLRREGRLCFLVLMTFLSEGFGGKGRGMFSPFLFGSV